MKRLAERHPVVLWVSDDGVHDGMPGLVIPDGRAAWSDSVEGALAEGITGS